MNSSRNQHRILRSVRSTALGKSASVLVRPKAKSKLFAHETICNAAPAWQGRGGENSKKASGVTKHCAGSQATLNPLQQYDRSTNRTVFDEDLGAVDRNEATRGAVDAPPDLLARCRGTRPQRVHLNETWEGGVQSHAARRMGTTAISERSTGGGVGARCLMLGVIFKIN